MWFLVGQGRNAGLRVWLKPEMTLTIGRKSSDDTLVLNRNDITVGRRHVEIKVSKSTMQNVRDRREHTKLTMRDLTSAFGVWVNNVRIESMRDIEVEIPESQLFTNQEPRHVAGQGYGGFVDVKIGSDTTFRLERVDWSICSSGLAAQSKVTIVGIAAEIDVKVEDSWVPGTSTHLVIGKNKLTEKMYLALTEGGYLVDTTWLKQQENCLKASWESKGQEHARMLELEHPAPVPLQFANPDVQWAPNYHRRRLFKDYRFISLIKLKYNSLDQVIRCAGGVWSMEDAKNAPKLISQCMVATVIPVFLCPSSEYSMAESYRSLHAILNRMGYRWVFENEIGQAILHASTEMFCNPKYLGSLPTMEAMATLHGSQASSMQLTESLGSVSMSTMPATLKKVDSTADDSKDTAQLMNDDHNPTGASFSLSQLIAPSRKTNRAMPNSATAHQIMTTTSITKQNDIVDRPAKKKTKTDHMALFFDGLDEDDEIMMLDQPGTKGTSRADAEEAATKVITPTVKATARSSSSLQKPIPVAWLDSLEIGQEDNEPNDKKEPTSVAITAECDHVLNASETIAPNDKTSVDVLAPTDGASQESISSSMSSYSGTGRKKKSSAFDAIRGDMMALKLDIKLGRQKESQDEQERLRRLEALRQEEKSKKEKSKIMQSARSEFLVAKSKRRKFTEDQASQDHAEPSASLLILDASDKDDWPERWRSLPNFKNITPIDPILQEKWKSVPNFKAFRKSILPGIPKEPRPPRSFTPKEEIALKQEETVQKMGEYLNREPKVTRPLSPVPRRKVSEKQMARDDLKLLLADDDND
ncbi:hypothetical protein BGZ51_000162 [Haplosporangium sp. Z 767]|nr:hypothetical protein BGZ51_000162 [Haplosporangium sp. Z 767]KAF9192221.1 hypothetical protein BGZ50_008739 [Haplosporangium sp. Z 11]